MIKKGYTALELVVVIVVIVLVVLISYRYFSGTSGADNTEGKNVRMEIDNR
jgi:prepilin-type N-terminal cleavage/methylation domain-containing protein